MGIRGRVVVLEEYGVLTVREVAFPSPGPGEVLLRVHAAAVDMDDLRLVQDPPPGRTLMGRSAVATVREAGDGVALARGAHVVVTPFLAAGVPDPLPAGVRVDGEALQAPVYSWATDLLLPAARVVPVHIAGEREPAAVLGSTGIACAGRTPAGATIVLDASAARGPADPAACVRELEAQISDGRISLTGFVRRRYFIEAANEAIRDLENGDVEGQAVIVMEALA
jgi:hypothetical protein